MSIKKINKQELHKIFEGIKNSDELEFNKLYEVYRNLVYGVAFSILKNREDSEEIVQVVFMKIFSLEKENLPIKSEANWLYSLTKNEAINLLRKKKNYVDIEMYYEIQDKNDELNKIIDEVSFNKLINKLKDKEKEIVSLKILSGFSFNEIAKLLNENENTVKWRYYKAINILQIIISNIGAFVITLFIAIKTLFRNEKSFNLEQSQITDETYKENIDNIDKSENKVEENIENNKRLENKDINIEKSKEETSEKIEETTVVDKLQEPQEVDTNYFGIGILSISIIFVIMVIINLIFIRKYQLKFKRRSSK